jgi:NTE family protein
MKTALVLAGGGSRGAYEMGVWQALREMDVKIDIVTGSSVGAMNAALITQDAYDIGRELWLTLKTEEVFDYKNAIENKGVRFTDIKLLAEKHLSEEKIRNSDVEMGIVTVKIPEMKPLRLWKQDIPDGELLDYVFASCSCFPLVMPYEIGGSSFIDGSYSDHMPVGMALEKKPNKIIAVDLGGLGRIIEEDIKAAGDRLTIIKCWWNLGSLAIFDPDHSAKILRLGYLDALKSLGAFSGRRYTFFRAQFPQKDIIALEQVGETFGLDPKYIYSKEVYLNRIKTEIEEYKTGTDEPLAEIRNDMDRYKKLISEGKLSELLSRMDLQKSANYAGSLARRGLLLGIADAYRKNPRIFASKSAKTLLGADLRAAEWLVAENMI